MDGLDKRSSERVPCRLPLAILCGGERQIVTAVDLSRTGVRVQAPLALFGLAGDVTLLTVARRLCEVLPHRTPAEFDPDRVGRLVTRQLEVARIGLSGGREPQVELGCRFHRPLSTVDVAAVGVDVVDPEDPDAWRPTVLPEDFHYENEAPPAPVPAFEPEPEVVLLPEPGTGRVPAADAPPADGFRPGTRRFRVHLAPMPGFPGSAVTAWSEGLTPEHVAILVPRRGTLGLPDGEMEVSELLVHLCEQLGEHPKARIVDGSRHLWSGPVRLEAVETFLGDDEALLIQLGFGRELRYAERSSLSIA